MVHSEKAREASGNSGDMDVYVFIKYDACIK
jgi:hypothetical protein